MAQLGAGIGLALAVFVEPVRLREARILRKMDEDLRTIANPKAGRGREEKNLILSEKLNLYSAARLLERKVRPPMGLIGLGAAINLVVLLVCTVDPDEPLGSAGVIVLLAFCILPFVAGWIWIAMLTAEHFGSLESRYDEARRALLEQ